MTLGTDIASLVATCPTRLGSARGQFSSAVCLVPDHSFTLTLYPVSSLRLPPYTTCFDLYLHLYTYTYSIVSYSIAHTAHQSRTREPTARYQASLAINTSETSKHEPSPSPSTMFVVKAIHTFTAEHGDELEFKAGENIEVLEKDEAFGDGWWRVSHFVVI